MRQSPGASVLRTRALPLAARKINSFDCTRQINASKVDFSIAYEEPPTGSTNLNRSICLSVSNPTSNSFNPPSRCVKTKPAAVRFCGRCAEISFTFVVGQHRRANGHRALLANLGAGLKGLLRRQVRSSVTGLTECCEL